MFFREDAEKLAGGKEVRYVSLIHNVWVEGKGGGKHARPINHARLGRAEELDDRVLPSMSKTIDPYRAKRFGTAATEGEVAREVRSEATALRKLASRRFGVRALAGGVVILASRRSPGPWSSSKRRSPLRRARSRGSRPATRTRLRRAWR